MKKGTEIKIAITKLINLMKGKGLDELAFDFLKLHDILSNEVFYPISIYYFVQHGIEAATGENDMIILWRELHHRCIESIHYQLSFIL